MKHANSEHGRILELQALIECYGLPFKSINIDYLTECMMNCANSLRSPTFHSTRRMRVTACVILYTCAVCVYKLNNSPLISSAIITLERKYGELILSEIVRMTPNVDDIVKGGYFILPTEIIEDLSNFAHEFAILRCLQGMRDLAIVISGRAHKDLIPIVLHYFRMIYIKND